MSQKHDEWEVFDGVSDWVDVAHQAVEVGNKVLRFMSDDPRLKHLVGYQCIGEVPAGRWRKKKKPEE